MPLHDYACAAHGELGEHMEKPACPHGCSPAFVTIFWKKPPGIKHNGTKVADSAIRALAGDFGLTNIGSNGGESVMDYIRRGQMHPEGYHPRDGEMGFAPRFMDVPHAAPGWSRTPDAKAPTVSPSAFLGARTQGENAAARAFGMSETGMQPSSDGHINIPQPKPHIDPKLVYRPTEMPSAPE